jgi:hypothetical protein
VKGRKVVHGKDIGRKAEGFRSDKVDTETSGCENERSGWGDRKGGG